MRDWSERLTFNIWRNRNWNKFCDKFKSIVVWFIFNMSSITQNCFEVKKKYLNAKSNNGDERKKVRDIA